MLPFGTRFFLGGDAHDFSSYLVPLGTADIFFPTNFSLFSHMYTRVCERECEVYNHDDFLKVFATDG